MASVPSEYEGQFPAVPTPQPPTEETPQEAVEAETEHRRFPTRSTSDPDAMRRFAIEAARMLADDRCEDVLCLDVRSLSQVSDYIVIASGTSDRQMRGAADDIERLADQHQFRVFRRSQDDRATWIVLDCVDIVVHIFEPNTRAHYDLEMLWGDAERVTWEREGGGIRVPGGRTAHASDSELNAAGVDEGVESDADERPGDDGADFDTGDSEINEEALTAPEGDQDDEALTYSATIADTMVGESAAERPSKPSPSRGGKAARAKGAGAIRAKTRAKSSAVRRAAKRATEKNRAAKKRPVKKTATKKAEAKKPASKSAKKSARKKR
ncbi:MAG TPA: ribosome silencing factor [Phycisphaerales bacterium]|nr:ribosome silencing factor [Phycisphaerales bacterium]